jgi:hypothetical protein
MRTSRDFIFPPRPPWLEPIASALTDWIRQMLPLVRRERHRIFSSKDLIASAARAAACVQPGNRLNVLAWLTLWP